MLSGFSPMPPGPPSLGSTEVGFESSSAQIGLPLAGLGVDDDHRLVRVVVGVQVVLRHEAGVVERGRRVEAGDLDRDQVAGAEAVSAVHVGRVDVDAVDVRRHRLLVQVEPLAGRRGGVVPGEVIVRERLQADRRVEEVAAVGVLDRDRGVGLLAAARVLLQAADVDRLALLAMGSVEASDLDLLGAATAEPLLAAVGEGELDLALAVHLQGLRLEQAPLALVGGRHLDLAGAARPHRDRELAVLEQLLLALRRDADRHLRLAALRGGGAGADLGQQDEAREQDEQGQRCPEGGRAVGMVQHRVRLSPGQRLQPRSRPLGIPRP